MRWAEFFLCVYSAKWKECTPDKWRRQPKHRARSASGQAVVAIWDVRWPVEKRQAFSEYGSVGIPYKRTTRCPDRIAGGFEAEL